MFTLVFVFNKALKSDLIPLEEVGIVSLVLFFSPPNRNLLPSFGYKKIVHVHCKDSKKKQ